MQGGHDEQNPHSASQIASQLARQIASQIASDLGASGQCAAVNPAAVFAAAEFPTSSGCSNPSAGQSQSRAPSGQARPVG